jgi:predicted kinase
MLRYPEWICLTQTFSDNLKERNSKSEKEVEQKLIMRTKDILMKNERNNEERRIIKN